MEEHYVDPYETAAGDEEPPDADAPEESEPDEFDEPEDDSADSSEPPARGSDTGGYPYYGDSEDPPRDQPGARPSYGRRGGRSRR